MHSDMGSIFSIACQSTLPRPTTAGPDHTVTMTDKDNANPIVYAQSTQPAHRTDEASREEWWRDSALSALHGTSSASGKSAFVMLPGRGSGGSDSGYGEDDDDDDYEHEDSKRLQPIKSTKTQKDDIDQHEVYDLVRSISDPEHPLTLEQLAVVNAEHIVIDEGDSVVHRAPHVLLEFTPTIPHCSMATLIGLALRVRLLRALPSRYKVDIRVRPGTHQSENAVNKQLNDKERVAAALENQHLLGVVSDCLATAGRRGASEEEAMRRADELAIEMGLTV